MTYADFFYEIKGKFMGTDVSDIKEHLAFQFSIEDEEAGGCFYVEVKEGQLYVEPYEYYDRDANFISDPDIFLKIAEGKIDPVWAFRKRQRKKMQRKRWRKMAQRKCRRKKMQRKRRRERAQRSRQ